MLLCMEQQTAMTDLNTCHRTANFAAHAMLAILSFEVRKDMLESDRTHVMQGLSVETDISNPDPAIHKAGIELLNKSMQVAFSPYNPLYDPFSDTHTLC